MHDVDFTCLLVVGTTRGQSLLESCSFHQESVPGVASAGHRIGLTAHVHTMEQADPPSNVEKGTMKRALMVICSVVIGAVSALPLIYLAWFVFFVLIATVTKGESLSVQQSMVWHISAMAISVVTFSSCMLAILFTPRFNRQERIRWLVLHIVFWPVVMPAYWWVHVKSLVKHSA